MRRRAEIATTLISLTALKPSAASAMLGVAQDKRHHAKEKARHVRKWTKNLQKELADLQDTRQTLVVRL